MIHYRTFQNTDPPRILDFWNRQTGARGIGVLANCDNLENLVLGKPVFDPKGLILAFDDDRLVGLVHGGFGCDEKESAVDYTMGTISLLLVDTQYRRQGIGSELLKQGQEYLRSRGTLVQYAGELYPLNPFYEGLYGGSEMPGVLESNTDVAAFLTKRGYTVADTAVVFQLSLDTLAPLDDKRTPLLRRRVELMVEPWPKPRSWWQSVTMGSLVTLGYEMVEQGATAPIGFAWAWEMDAFGRAWGKPVVGITNLQIDESHRRQGFGKVMLFSILKHLKDQGIGLVEAQTMDRNTAARGLYQSLGFHQVDTGHVYRQGPSEPQPPSLEPQLPTIGPEPPSAEPEPPLAEPGSFSTLM